VTAALQGRYAIERELGRGGMATVYLAEDQKLHRRVALKVLHPDLAATLGPERFQREIAQKDRAALERARADSRRSGHPLGGFLDRSLAAYGLALAGDRLAAGRQLAALQVCSVTRECGYRIMASVATDRLAAATWLLGAGDTAQATRLLIWYESLQGNWDATFNHVAAAMGYLMRARIDEAQGDTRSAKTHYEYFLRRFDAPMPRQRHLVEEARAALARLSRESS
jgi:hypothetical protein